MGLGHEVRARQPDVDEMLAAAASAPAHRCPSGWPNGFGNSPSVIQSARRRVIPTKAQAD
jgi:hypothetical protein